MEAHILRVENLVKHYEDGFILDIPRLEFQAGKIYSIVGPNGAGKTTLLNLLSLLELPDNGKIFFNGQEITNSNSRLIVRRKISMVMENPVLFHTTVFNNIVLGLRFRTIDKKDWQSLSENALKMMGLDGFGKREAHNLSRGETQRVAIARAVVLNPEILLLDEPFSNIDKNSVEVIENLIKTVNSTIIFTTHDLAQAYRLADKVITIFDGKLVSHRLENLFTGEIEEVNGEKFVKLSPAVKIAVVTEKNGKVHISIQPQEIIISYQPLESSAKNSFKGIINRIQLERQVVRVFVDAGVEFVALITLNSYNDMRLAIGAQVYITFKSTAVTIL